jgi:isopentenyl-diphosphate delta-isomerase
MKEMVVLVDDNDRELGSGEKLAVHRAGQLHRAFSVFVTDPSGAVVLQRRAATKYHSAGRWSNTCCGHPRPGEPLLSAAHRRLGEEMGFDCELSPAFSFTYRVALENGLIEHELDHVVIGTFGGTPRPDPSEVSEWKALRSGDLIRDLAAHPDRYTAWLPLAVEGLLSRNLLMTGD